MKKHRSAHHQQYHPTHFKRALSSHRQKKGHAQSDLPIASDLPNLNQPNTPIDCQSESDQPSSKRLSPTRKLIAMVSIFGLVIGFALAIPLTTVTNSSLPANLDVTFINPRQAMVFWQSESVDVGYIKLGTNKWWRPTKVVQISEEATTTHAVLLEQLPLEASYISLHTENEPFLKFPRVIKIEYTEEKSQTDQPIEPLVGDQHNLPSNLQVGYQSNAQSDDQAQLDETN